MFDTATLPDLPEEPRADWLKAARRFRGRNLTRSVSADYGAVGAERSAICEAAGFSEPEKRHSKIDSPAL
jgi:hypothetical protein